MPVARIISSNFEDALKVSEELRPLFDTIEIAAPGRAGDIPADLEISLENCTVEEALAEIGKISQDQEVSVFVAPGSIVPVEVETVPRVEPEVIAPAAELKFESTSEDPAQMLEYPPQILVRDTAWPTKSHEASVAETQTIAAMEQCPVLEIAQPKKSWLASIRQTMEQWQAQRAQLSERRAVGRLQRTAARQRQFEEREKQRRLAREQEARQRQDAARKAALLRAQQQRAAQEHAEQKRRAHDAERARAAEVAARQRIEAELRREVLAQQELARQAELGQRANAARLAQAEAIRRNQADEERRRLQEDQQRAVVSGSLSGSSAPPAVAALQPHSAGSADDRRMRAAAMCAGAAALLLMAGWIGYTNRRPASPLPVSTLQQSNSVEETVPFGPAKLVPALGVAPSRSHPAPTTAKPSAAQPRPPVHKAKRQQITEVEVDEVAEDVTVRHFKPKPPVKIARPRDTSSSTQPAAVDLVRASNRSDVKQISDLH